MRIQREKHKEKSLSQKSVTVLMEEAVREMERLEPHRALGALLQTLEMKGLAALMVTIGTNQMKRLTAPERSGR